MNDFEDRRTQISKLYERLIDTLDELQATAEIAAEYPEPEISKPEEENVCLFVEAMKLEIDRHSDDMEDFKEGG